MRTLVGSDLIRDRSYRDVLKKEDLTFLEMTGEGSDNLSLYSSKRLKISSFFGSRTQSNRLMTTKGRMIRPYSDGLKSPRRTSSAVDQMREEIFDEFILFLERVRINFYSRFILLSLSQDVVVDPWSIFVTCPSVSISTGSSR